MFTLGAIGFLVGFVALILAIVALSNGKARADTLERRLAALRDDLALLRTTVAHRELGADAAPSARPEPIPAPAPAFAPAPSVADADHDAPADDPDAGAPAAPATDTDTARWAAYAQESEVRRDTVPMMAAARTGPPDDADALAERPPELTAVDDAVVIAATPASDRASVRSPEPPPAPPSATLERTLGLTWATRIGGVLLLLGVLFFFKVASERNWLGPWARVASGLGAGAVCVGLAALLRKRLAPRWVGVMVGVGLAILLGAVWAAHAIYELIPGWVAFVAVTLFALGAGAIAVAWRLESVLATAAGAGFTNLAALSATFPGHALFMAYAAVLTLAVLFTAARRGWALAAVAVPLGFVPAFVSRHFGIGADAFGGPLPMPDGLDTIVAVTLACLMGAAYLAAARRIVTDADTPWMRLARAVLAIGAPLIAFGTAALLIAPSLPLAAIVVGLTALVALERWRVELSRPPVLLVTETAHILGAALTLWIAYESRHAPSLEAVLATLFFLIGGASSSRVDRVRALSEFTILGLGALIWALLAPFPGHAAFLLATGLLTVGALAVAVRRDWPGMAAFAAVAFLGVTAARHVGLGRDVGAALPTSVLDSALALALVVAVAVACIAAARRFSTDARAAGTRSVLAVVAPLSAFGIAFVLVTDPTALAAVALAFAAALTAQRVYFEHPDRAASAAATLPLLVPMGHVAGIALMCGIAYRADGSAVVERILVLGFFLVSGAGSFARTAADTGRGVRELALLGGGAFFWALLARFPGHGVFVLCTGILGGAALVGATWRRWPAVALWVPIALFIAALARHFGFGSEHAATLALSKIGGALPVPDLPDIVATLAFAAVTALGFVVAARRLAGSGARRAHVALLAGAPLYVLALAFVLVPRPFPLDAIVLAVAAGVLLHRMAFERLRGLGPDDASAVSFAPLHMSAHIVGVAALAALLYRPGQPPGLAELACVAAFFAVSALGTARAQRQPSASSATGYVDPRPFELAILVGGAILWTVGRNAIHPYLPTAPIVLGSTALAFVAAALLRHVTKRRPAPGARTPFDVPSALAVAALLVLLILELGLPHPWTTVALALLALAWVRLAVAVSAPPLLAIAGAIFVIAVGHFVLRDMLLPEALRREFVASDGAEGRYFPPLLVGPRSLSLLVLGLVALLARVLARPWRPRHWAGRTLDLTHALGLLLLLVFAIDLGIQVINEATLSGLDLRDRSVVEAALADAASTRAVLSTAVLALFGAGVLGWGFLQREPADRLGGLALIAFALLKLASADLIVMDSVARTVVLVGFGILLLSSGFLYARFAPEVKTWLKPSGARAEAQDPPEESPPD